MAIDLNHYYRSIKYKEDKDLFHEAVICGQHHALKACYIMLWSTLTQSLKRRIIEIGKRDSSTAKIAMQIQKMEEDRKSVDHYLLIKAKDIGIYDDSVLNDLEYLFSKRSQIVHPYSTTITEEDINHAASIIVNAVLKHPIRLKHSFGEQLIQNLLEPHYVDSGRESVRSFFQSMYNKMDPCIMQWFINQYLNKLDIAYQDTSYSRRKLLIWRGIWIISFIIRKRPSVYTKSEYHTVFNSHPVIMSWVLGEESIFKIMNGCTKHSLLQHILDNPKDGPRRLMIIDRLISKGLVAEKYCRSYQKLIKNSDIGDLPVSELSIDTMSMKLSDMLDSYEFDVNNAAIEYIDQNMDRLHKASKDDLVMLGRMIIKCAKRNCFKAQSFIDDLKVHEIPVGLLVGMIIGNLFNLSEFPALKYEYLKQTIDLFTIHNQKDEVFKLLFDEMDSKIEIRALIKNRDSFDSIIEDSDFLQALRQYLESREEKEENHVPSK